MMESVSVGIKKTPIKNKAKALIIVEILAELQRSSSSALWCQALTELDGCFLKQ